MATSDRRTARVGRAPPPRHRHAGVALLCGTTLAPRGRRIAVAGRGAPPSRRRTPGGGMARAGCRPPRVDRLGVVDALRRARSRSVAHGPLDRAAAGQPLGPVCGGTTRGYGLCRGLAWTSAGPQRRDRSIRTGRGVGPGGPLGPCRRRWRCSDGDDHQAGRPDRATARSCAGRRGLPIQGAGRHHRTGGPSISHDRLSGSREESHGGGARVAVVDRRGTTRHGTPMAGHRRPQLRAPPDRRERAARGPLATAGLGAAPAGGCDVATADGGGVRAGGRAPRRGEDAGRPRSERADPQRCPCARGRRTGCRGDDRSDDARRYRRYTGAAPRRGHRGCRCGRPR